uniref:Uncharacterized protein n=1 Tax=Setaria viridis TaxID=4556 RepID=A0A4U6UQD3_SETVI|nr:hypothetical protein SEVIR_5G442400v2 [Setaria viridis]TKW18615.1 hypothetical protein SEVIR_5G442800v2 [Setaria viridis]
MYDLTDDNQIDAFFTSSDVTFTLVKLRLGDYIISFLANDFMMMIADLRTIANPKLPTLWIDLYPALLPMACYGPAFMKFHGLFMKDDSGLLSTHISDAAAILKNLSYRTPCVPEDVWTIIPNNDPWLDHWFSHIKER